MSETPCTAAFRYHIAASASFCGTPSPIRYIFPKVDWASGTPCSAALRYHFAASALFFGTPSPFRYIFPRVDWASGTPCSAALRYHFAASALFFGTPSPFRYIFPREDWASGTPCSAALRYHCSATSAFFGTPSPFLYLSARPYCASGSPFLALSSNSETSADDAVCAQIESPNAKTNPAKTIFRMTNPPRDIKKISIKKISVADNPTHDIMSLPLPERTTGNFVSVFRRRPQLR